jgi:hypothetical protein
VLPVLLALKVLQFYASPTEIFEGEQALICYGTEDAISVRIAPQVEKLSPSLTRCISVSPRRSTTYKFIAEGRSGDQLNRTTRILVKPVPRPAPAILYFTAEAASLKSGETVKLCFRLENTESVRLEPAVQDLGSALMGCFVVAPKQTTTYTLIAVGTEGRTARKRVTVTVL